MCIRIGSIHDRLRGRFQEYICIGRLRFCVGQQFGLCVRQQFGFCVGQQFGFRIRQLVSGGKCHEHRGDHQEGC